MKRIVPTPIEAAYGNDRIFTIGIISLIGGCAILFMGYESMNPVSPESEITKTKPNSLAKGVLANALSPHPYLFWFSAGGPIMSRAINLNVKAPFAFI